MDAFVQNKVFGLLAGRPQASRLTQWFPQCGPGWRVSSPPWKLLEIQILRPTSRPTKSETLEVALSNLCLIKSFRWFWSVLNFEKHWLKLLRLPFLLFKMVFLKPTLQNQRGKHLTEKDSGSDAVTFYQHCLFFFFFNQGSKLRGIRTSKWCVNSLRLGLKCADCQQWAGYQNRPLASALEIWPPKSKRAKCPRSHILSPYKLRPR